MLDEVGWSIGESVNASDVRGASGGVGQDGDAPPCLTPLATLARAALARGTCQRRRSDAGQKGPVSHTHS